MSDERRLAIWYLPHRRVYEVFARRDMPMRCWLESAEMRPPGGAVLMGVHYDFSKQAFAFLLQHESFGIVPEGAEIPAFQAGNWDVIGCSVLKQVDDETYKVATTVL